MPKTGNYTKNPVRANTVFNGQGIFAGNILTNTQGLHIIKLSKGSTDAAVDLSEIGYLKIIASDSSWGGYFFIIRTVMVVLLIVTELIMPAFISASNNSSMSVCILSPPFWGSANRRHRLALAAIRKTPILPKHFYFIMRPEDCQILLTLCLKEPAEKYFFKCVF